MSDSITSAPAEPGPAQGRAVPPPALVHAPVAQLLQPLRDLRDRTAPDYRAFFDRLVADLRARGVQVPILAYREGERFRIIDGLTRYLAALLAVLDTVPVLVYPETPDDAALKLGQLLANSMRRDMTVLELAAVYQDLKRLNGWSDAELARHARVSPGHVAKVMAISTRLCEPCRAMVSRGDLAPRAAYALSRLADAPAQVALAERFQQGTLCVEGVEVEVARFLSGGKKAKADKPLTLRQDGIELKAKKPTAEALRAFLDRLAAALKRLKGGDDIGDLPFHFRTA